MTTATKIAEVVDDAEEFPLLSLAHSGAPKPQLLIEDYNPDHTVATLRDILADAGRLYERGVPVRLQTEDEL
jgi:hypothetical protein